MPPGPAARRLAPVTLSLSLALAASSGCQVPTWASRVPGSAEVKTRVEGDRARSSVVATRDVGPESQPAPKPEPIDEASPLPPALVRPTTPPPEPAATPLLDEALARAEARNRDLIEVLAKEDTPEPAVALALAPPIPVPPPAAPAPPKAEPAPKPPEPEPKTQEQIWREGIQALRSVARDHLQDTRNAVSGGPSWAVRDRLLAWLAEPDIDPEARTGDLARGRAVLKGLAAVIDRATAKAGGGVDIREAVQALEASAPLEIAELTPCRMVRGFGDIDPLDPPTRKPGQSVVLYCEIDGLAYEPAGSSFRSRVEGKAELFPEGSDSPSWSHPLPTVEDTCRKRRRDYFIGHKFTLPDGLAPGKYRLRLTQRDLVADHVATRETAIEIAR